MSDPVITSNGATLIPDLTRQRIRGVERGILVARLLQDLGLVEQREALREAARILGAV